MTARLRAVALVALLCACGPKRAETPVGLSEKPGASAQLERPLAFAFDSLDERPVTSEATRGKPTVLAFVVTGDLDAQAQVNFLVAMAKNDAANVNYVLVALHPRREIVLVDTYVRTLKVTFPVALADAAAVAAIFGELPAIPTVVVLDHNGKMVWKHTGLAKAQEIRAHMPR